MSSTSLSTGPSEISSWHSSLHASRTRHLLPPDAISVPGTLPGTSTTSKRRGATSSELTVPQRFKRRREATPIAEGDDESTSGDRPIREQNASAPTYTTTAAAPSSYTAQEEEGNKIVATSEGGEGSLLFSENGAMNVQEFGGGAAKDYWREVGNGEAGWEAAAIGAEPESKEIVGGVAGNVDLADTGEFDVEEADDGGEENTGHEESQDRNDLLEEGEADAELPARSSIPHPIPSVTVPASSKTPRIDRMSRILEGPPKKATSSTIRKDPVQIPEHDDEFCINDGSPPQSNYHSGDSDDFAMNHRPILERTEIKRDIKDFVKSLGVMLQERTGSHRYKVIDRLGEGTFSSVYLAQDRQYARFVNDYWTGEPNSPDDLINHSDMTTDRLVALKKILATSSPQRIENELNILESLRGCRNVTQLVTAFREEDQVIIILPFHRSDDFRHFYRHMDFIHVRQYMRALMRALKDIHQRGIVHRDVKPANFLYDYEKGDGVLCDFGLAERYVPPRKSSCQHGPATLTVLHGTKVQTAETSIVEQAVYDARKRSKLGEGRIGFLQDDKRPTIKTNRAGTRGFRAPEVLLKCPDQTVAIDVWSAGIILLSILTHKFPVFNSSDDIEALMEIAAIFGRPAMERCALLHNRTIITNVPSLDSAPPSLSSIILKLNPHIFTPPMQHPSSTDAKAHIEAVDHAINLCTRMLRLDVTNRITAANALRHPFLRPAEEKNFEDAFDVEGLNGEDGKCGYLHRTEGGKHRAYFSHTLQDMQFGQGIPESRDQLCPEHEHWQLRMQVNPLLACRRFDDDDDSGSETCEDLDESGKETSPEAEDDEELVVEEKVEEKRRRPALTERDTNVASHEVGSRRRIKA